MRQRLFDILVSVLAMVFSAVAVVLFLYLIDHIVGMLFFARFL